ncbi:unnamed protein product [Mytilus coruscus]|uniref:Uncharacterized protein n=1 Tax=Mytilus coruscus TaxID=42192 RepID=A0A6J8ATW8_MYTCO|nr:unnamed protein product [Mytilus coruscus]
MNRDFRNQDKSEDVNSYGIMKTTYWKMYGVKSLERRKTKEQCKDIMFVVNCYDVIRSIRNIGYPIHRETSVMETDNNHPRFTRLRFKKAVGVSVQCQCRSGTCTSKRWYLSVNNFLDKYKNNCYNHPMFLHGPCLLNRENTFDIAYCFRSKYLPKTQFLGYSVVDGNSHLIL